MRFGFSELLLILAIFVLLFGATQIPKVSKAVAQAVKDFKKEIKTEEETGKDNGEV